MPKLYDELRTLISALDRDKIEYALCGGIAMAIHGRPRATVDIDILIPADSLDQVLKIAEPRLYDTRARYGFRSNQNKATIENRSSHAVCAYTRYDPCYRRDSGC